MAQRGTRNRRAAVAALLLLAAGLTGVVGGAAPSQAAPRIGVPRQAVPPGATIAVTPSTGLVDFQTVHVTGSGFEPFTIMEIFQCRGGAVGEADCDGYNAFDIDSDGAGNIVYNFPVDARIYLPDGTPYDCRTEPAGCEIGVGYLLDADESPEAALQFDPSAPLRPPVTGSVTPSSGLVDGQVVAVHGENLSPNEEAFSYLCAVGDGELGTRCDLDAWARGVPEADGSVDLSLTVRAPFNPPLGGTVDCRTAASGCEVVVAWGFNGPVDRVARLPVSFAQQVTTTTTTTTTTTVPPGTPTAPPASPVSGTATFTG